MTRRDADAKEVTVYPVEWVGREVKTKGGGTALESEATVRNQRWALWDPSDIQPAAKEDRDPAPHPTRRIRRYYRREDAEAFRGEAGFILHAPEGYVPLDQRGPPATPEPDAGASDDAGQIPGDAVTEGEPARPPARGQARSVRGPKAKPE